jgi:TolB-like protein
LPLPDKPSIAVLPFENLSGDPKQERLADGITEDIITDLSRFRELFVIARNSTFVYKDRPTDVRQIALELGVQYVLEGSLQFDDDRVRITAQLVDATTGSHVWSERYDRTLDDIFAIQDEVTRTIAASLAGQHGIVARATRETARRKPANSLRAYENYTLGMEHKHRFAEADNNKARELFLRAIALDPNFARAYVGLAMTHSVDIDLGLSESQAPVARALGRCGTESDRFGSL